MLALLISERRRRLFLVLRMAWYCQRLGQSFPTVTMIQLTLLGGRMRLDFGGDDITELLHTLLQRISFPYRELDISKWGDWHLIENLKERMIVLSEVSHSALESDCAALTYSILQMDVGLNLYDFYARSPGKKTKKYLLRAYDEVILAPYVSPPPHSLTRILTSIAVPLRSSNCRFRQEESRATPTLVEKRL